MAQKEQNTGLSVGLNKGHIVADMTKKQSVPRPSDTKGETSKRVHFVRNVVRQIVGFSPYEKRLLERLVTRKDKRALKVAKDKLGTHDRAKSKREKMSGWLRKLRSPGGAEQ